MDVTESTALTKELQPSPLTDVFKMLDLDDLFYKLLISRIV